ncbi:hypothetical protein MMC07_003594 [Pseudocyphellaria aurata]|nr:hypothetical protein [Pseudocyphellaria aurata]
MQLRRNVKAPKRYDDESFNDPDRTPDNPPPPPPAPSRAQTRIHPSLRPKIIEFNPNLPPAAFPTLDSWLPRESAADDRHRPVKSVSSASSSTAFDPRPSNFDPRLSPIGAKNEAINPPTLPAMTFGFQGMDRWTDREAPMTHPPYSMMTSEEQFMFDMQTSDEEEPSGKGPERKRKVCEILVPTFMTDQSQMVKFNVQGEGILGESNLSSSFNNCPRWEELSVAHQIDLVHILSDLHGTIAIAMEKLRLDQRQAEITLDLIDQHNEQEAMENARVDAFQKRIKAILLDKAGRFKHVSQEAFRQLATKHLYNDSAGLDSHFSTAAEFGKAARYLESCGHAPGGLLDHWHDEFGAQAVTRLPGTTRSLKRKLSRLEDVGHPGNVGHPGDVGHPEDVGRSKQAASPDQKLDFPDTPNALPSSASPRMDPAFNPTAASSSRKTIRNIRHRQVGATRAARKRANRSGNPK